MRGIANCLPLGLVDLRSAKRTEICVELTVVARNRRLVCVCECLHPEPERTEICVPAGRLAYPNMRAVSTRETLLPYRLRTLLCVGSSNAQPPRSAPLYACPTFLLEQSGLPYPNMRVSLWFCYT